MAHTYFTRASLHTPRSDLNALVLNYLIVEGYKPAAEAFAAESGLTTGVKLASIDDRMQIRDAIEKGRVDEAVERVNDLDPDVCPRLSALLFFLWRPVACMSVASPVDTVIFPWTRTAASSHHSQFHAQSICILKRTFT